MNHEPINLSFLTNNYSIISKYSAVKFGYFDDKILEDFIENHLASKSWRRTPLVNRGYGARLLAINLIVNRYIMAEAVDCFIVLGAGYDTLPFRLTHNCCFIELDLPQVVDVKSAFIKDKNILKDEHLIQAEHGRYSSSGLKYHLAACDLRDTDKLMKILRSILDRMAEFRICPKNFAIINEVCLCYLEITEISRLLKTLIESVQESALKVHYIGYEQVKPNKSQFDSVMLDHFHSIGHPLKHYPSSEQIHQLLTNDLNFFQVKIESMHKIFHNDLLISRSHQKGFTEEPFDEYEEMDLYLSHYALITGTLYMKATTNSETDKQYIGLSPRDYVASNSGDRLNSINLNISDKQVNLVRSNIQRFGHSSCSLSDTNSDGYAVLSCGGFGKSQASSSSSEANHHHKRLSDCFVLSTNQNKSFNVIPLDIDDVMSKSIRLDRMHGQSCELTNGLLFFNGGRQGPATGNSNNVSFIASLDGTRLVVDHRFNFEDSSPCWRHKITCLNDEEILQIGGKVIQAIPNGCNGAHNNPVVMWNMSSDKLGPHCVNFSDDTVFRRHSFGIDKRDSKTLLLFGGLSPSTLQHNDLPIDESNAALLWDLREKVPIKLMIESAKCYGANVHFISENQFVKIGGVSTRDGLANGIELFDLRQTSQSFEKNVPLPVVDGQPMILTNTTTCHLKSERKIITIGGGGNYFTFGTNFNRYHLVYQY